MRYLIVIMALCASALGQGLGIITSTRSVDWTHAGLSATLGDGETTTNPWTPPTGRTQCVNTQCAAVTSAAGSSTVTQINAAIANAPAQTYVLLPSGTYIIGGSGTVTISGTAVTGTGGTPFQSDWGGKTLVAGGSCTISTVNSTSSITLSSNPGGVCVSGTYSVSTNLTFVGSNNYITLRGSGPMSTILNFGGSSTSINYAVCCNSAQNGSLSASSYTVGTTSVTITSATCSATCSNLTVGSIGFFIECDQGNTGAPPYGGFASTCTGTYADPYPSGQSPVWQCGRDEGICNQNNSPNGTHAYNQQNVTITSVTNNGGGSYTVGFTPGLYSADWSSTRNAILWWSNSTDDSFGIGLEDMTIHMVAGGSNNIGFGGTCNSWIKGVRLIDGSVNTALSMSRGCHNLEANNYIVASDPAALIANISEAITIGDATTSGGMSDNLFLNNIVTDTLTYWGEGNDAGNVSAYNHSRNAQQPDYQTVMLDHFAGQIFELNEGNFFGRYQVDITHGTPNLGTLFRSYVNGDDPPFYTQNPGTTQYPGYARFFNALGNALGGNRSTSYSGTSFSQGFIYAIQNNSDNSGNVDPLVPSGFFRWGNCDVVTAGCKFDNTEVPGTLSSNAAAYSQAIPASHNLPCSFFIAAYANNVSSPCVPKMSGGTGLSWWKVCTSFSSFPTCTGSTIQPFPPVGPELGAGPFVNGFAYDNPAGVAFKTLPIDTSFQSSFTVTASAWSNNGALCSIAGAGSAPAPYTPCMILTVSLASIGGNVSAEHIMGGFQLVSAPAGCYPSSGISFTGRADKEIWITSSSTTQIVYALAADPGANACAVTLKYPDVRQFDESVFQADSGGGATANSSASGVKGAGFTMH